ncbi:TlpA family protein disulfide reductase [Chryseobacterium suipulveris]|uniref:TlpA family protein disulfide reductase n=1 Tax=Chryseobacterium suipulveris TaxID=2929800 RepID=A0ABY4BY84_9FLAO|nr:TlpA disulfide reductase family protein [Chryseobacterium suipulveris]UOE41485.1 TlpA family protein disulfide reductase [Chryseobacterium suipulveris]
MNFLKKNLFYLVATAILLVVWLVPSVRVKLNTLFFPIATVEEAITLNDADYNIQLKGMNVPDANLKDFKGKKLVLLNFWGTWCAPCREEWPTIQKLHDSKKDKVDFVLIAMQDKEEAVKKFLQENNYTVPVYMAESPVTANVLPKAFPTTFLLDKNGRILLKEDASKDWNTKSVHDMIDAMAK